MRKDKVIEIVKEFPQEVDLDELIERLIFVDKTEKGLKQIDEGKTISHADVKAMAKTICD